MRMRGDKHILRRSSSAKAFIFRLAEEAIRNGASIYWAPERDTVLVRLAGGGYASCSRDALSITDGRLETIWCCPTGNGAGASVRKCADGVEVRLFSGRSDSGWRRAVGEDAIALSLAGLDDRRNGTREAARYICRHFGLRCHDHGDMIHISSRQADVIVRTHSVASSGDGFHVVWRDKGDSSILFRHKDGDLTLIGSGTISHGRIPVMLPDIRMGDFATAWTGAALAALMGIQKPEHLRAVSAATSCLLAVAGSARLLASAADRARERRRRVDELAMETTCVKEAGR